MKTAYYVYLYDKPARFTFGGKTLELTKGSTFVLDYLHNKPVVVKDGFRYPLNSKYLKAFLQRCELLKPAKPTFNAIKAFDVYGHQVLKYLKHWSERLSNGREIESGFVRGEVFAKWSTSKPGVFCVLRCSMHAIGAGVYHAGDFDVAAWKTWPTLVQTVERIAQRMSSRDGVEVGKFETRRARVANITMPWGPFSGSVTYYTAKISI